MIRINLAPELLVQNNQKDVIKLVLILAACISVVYFSPSFYADAKRAEAEEVKLKTAERREQIKKLKLDVEKAKELKVRVGDLQSRSLQIRSLSQGRKQPVLVLDKLQQQHLERMWFQEVKLKNKKVSIVAIALDHSIVSEYARRLKSVSGEGGLDTVDVKDFEPEFHDAVTLKEAALDAAKAPKSDSSGENERAPSDSFVASTDVSVLPLKFSNVSLKFSKNVLVEAMPLEIFELDFDTNVP